MVGRFSRAAGLLLALGLLLQPRPAAAVIKRLTPLKEVLAGQQFIFTARVAALDAQKPSLVLTADEDYKGQIPCRRLPVNMTGDSEAKKENQVPLLFRRLAPDLPVIIFAGQRGKNYTAFVYSNGTWFQMIGQTDADPKTVRWSLTHGEPYLRRTFRGSTADLCAIIRDGLAGKKAPPDPDEQAEPGFGPEVLPKEKKTDGQCDARESIAPSPPIAWGGLRLAARVDQPVYAVIPTAFLMGPLALLATLFPAVFGGFQRRWLVLLSIISLNSTLFVTYFLLRGHIKDYWWGSLPALWVLMALVTLAGACWSWRRYRGAVRAAEADGLLPRPGEETVLRLLSYGGIGVAIYAWGKGVLLDPAWKELLALWSVVWAGALYAYYLRAMRRRTAAQPVAPLEGVMLGVMALACVGIGTSSFSGNPAAAVESAEESEAVAATSDRPAPRPGVLRASFEPTDRGTIDSSPLVAGDRVYAAAAHRAGFTAYGTVYCLDRASQKVLWTFDAGGSMKPVFSSPCLADGRLYVGEGYHQDGQCKLYCLNAATGAPVWEFQTGSHTESSPCVVGGKVYFGAGDDGVYCVDAATGAKVWQRGGMPVDASPAVADGRVFAGSGYGEQEVFCLDAATGEPVWRVPLDLPAFGSPTVAGKYIFVGLGNGDMLTSAAKPAGAVLCLEGATGKRVWRYDVRDAVHGRPAVDERHVYVGARDHHVYCLRRTDGRLVWERDLQSPVVASPAVTRCRCCGAGQAVYAVASGGRVSCLDPESGQPFWSFDVQKLAGMKPQLLSSPTLVVETDGRRQLWFGAGLNNLVTWTPKLYCLEDKATDERR